MHHRTLACLCLCSVLDYGDKFALAGLLLPLRPRDALLVRARLADLRGMLWVPHLHLPSR